MKQVFSRLDLDKGYYQVPVLLGLFSLIFAVWVNGTNFGGFAYSHDLGKISLDIPHALVDLHLVDMANCFVLLTAGMNISRCLYICIACDVCALAGSLRMK